MTARVCCTYTTMNTGLQIYTCGRDAVCMVRIHGGSQKRGERWAPRCKMHDGQRRKSGRPLIKPLEEA